MAIASCCVSWQENWNRAVGQVARETQAHGAQERLWLAPRPKKAWLRMSERYFAKRLDQGLKASWVLAEGDLRCGLVPVLDIIGGPFKRVASLDKHFSRRISARVTVVQCALGWSCSRHGQKGSFVWCMHHVGAESRDGRQGRTLCEQGWSELYQRAEELYFSSTEYRVTHGCMGIHAQYMIMRVLSYMDDPASSGKTRPGYVSFFGLSHKPRTYIDTGA